MQPGFLFLYMKLAFLLLLILILEPAVLLGQDFGRADSILDVVHYSLELYPDINAKSLTGSAALHVRCQGARLDTIVLDAVGMNVRRVRLLSGTEPRYSADSVRLYIALPAPLGPNDTASIGIEYDSKPEKGMYFIVPDSSFPRKREQFWTHGQPGDARFWFPCHDVPWDKATASVSVYADTSFTVIGNGRLVSHEYAGGGKALWSWTMEKPHSTYLFAVAGSRYEALNDVWNTVPIHSYYFPGTPAEVARAAYNATPRMMKFFESITGVHYPWNRYAQLPCTDFPFGGMENTTATFLSDQQALMDLRARQDYTDQHLIAHELAHQWWGDLVTCRDWDDLWINEGFATYYQQLWSQHAEGREEYEYQRYKGIGNILEYLDGENPLPVRAHEKNSPHNLYTKGASILAMLSDWFGGKKFNAVVARMLRERSYGSITTADLVAAFERETGTKLAGFVSQWIDRTSYPVVDVVKSWDRRKKTLTLTLHQESSWRNDPGLYLLPIEIDLGPKQQPLRFVFGTRDTVLQFKRNGEPEYFEMPSLMPARFRISQSKEELTTRLEQSPSAGGRISAALSLMQWIREKPVRETLFQCAVRDPFYGVRFEIATALTRLHADTSNYRDAVKDVFILLTRDGKASVRATALNGLSAFKDTALVGVFRSCLQDSSYHVEAAAMNCLAALKLPDLERILLPRLKSESYSDILALAALPWVEEYRLLGLQETVTGLTGPGHSMKVRYSAMKALLQLDMQPERLLALSRRMLTEPNAEARYLALSVIALRFAPDAPRIFHEHLRNEQEKILRTLIEEYLVEHPMKEPEPVPGAGDSGRR